MQFPKNARITIDMVLKSLSNQYGKKFADYVFEEKTGEVKGFLQFLINGKSASNLQGLNSQLQENDILAIIPPVGGG
jgi:molybdopterin converting factor small subunit